MKIIDTHTHLYLQDFANDIEQILKRAFNEGVEKFYLPSIDSKQIPAMLELESRYPNVCFAMIGLHPCSVKEDYQDELIIANEWLKKENLLL